MLYVFLVNTGEMLTLDMALTMESVQQLHDALADEYQIPHDKQVLLISGGQSLDPMMRVCSYSAGTDTNPIFLFSKGTIESAHPPVTASMQQAREDNLKLQVEGLKNLPPSYSAVVARTQLALQFHEVAKEKLRLCEETIHNQHLQQQGWMAVIANLDDITSAFQQRAAVFQQNVIEFLRDRPALARRLDQFGDVLRVLEKTPLLPCLVGGDRSPTLDMNPQEGGTVTLMMWISRQDQRSTLQQMAGQCSKVLEQFNQPVLDSLSTEIKTCLEAVSNPGMKEIKGLGERLFGLDQLSLQARKLLTEQAEMAQGLVQNQTRASNIKDPSVLPDLCLSHQQQLTVMYKKHLQLTDMSRRCEVAKEELCQNLHVRLRWVMYVEQQISSVHGKMVVYHENLKRLRKRLEIIRQVCMAPQLYATAVVEVCRRKAYDKQYRDWAGHVSDKSVCEHDSEVERRKKFASLMQNHFLNALFPGFYEMPPSFATTPPGDYDNSLPNVAEEDIQILRDTVPELAQSLELPSGDHFSSNTSEQVKPHPPRTTSIETQTEGELLSQEPTTHLQASPAALSSIDIQAEPLSKESSTRLQASPPALSSMDAQPLVGTIAHPLALLDSPSDDLKAETFKHPLALLDSPPDDTKTVSAVEPLALSDSPSDSTKTINETQATNDVQLERNLSQSESAPQLEPELSQPRLLSLDMPPTRVEAAMSPNDTEDFDTARFAESVYRDAPFSSLLPEVDSEFHSAIGSPMDEGLVRRAKVEQMLPAALAPVQENQTLRQRLEEREQIIEEREQILQELEQKRAVLEKALSVSESQIDTLQESVTSRSQRLEESRNMVSSLHVVVQKHVRELRVRCDGIKTSVVETRQHMQQEVATALLRISERSQNFEKDMEDASIQAVEVAVEEVEKRLGKEKGELVSKVCELNAQLEQVTQRQVELENELKSKDSNTEMLKSKYQQDLEDVKLKLEEEEKEMITSVKMGLEMEITDLEANIQEKEKEIRQLRLDAAQSVAEIERRLTDNKAAELERLRAELEKEHKSRLNAAEMVLQNTHLEEFADFKKSSHLQLESELETQRKQLEAEHREAMDRLQGESDTRVSTMQQELKTQIERAVEEEKVQGRTVVKETVEEQRAEAERLGKEQEEERSRMEREFRVRLEAETSSLEQRLSEERERFEKEMGQIREEKEGTRKEMQEKLAAETEAIATAKSRHEAEERNLRDEIRRLETELEQKEEELRQKEAELGAKWAESIATERTSSVLAALEEAKQEEEKRIRGLRERLDEEKQEAIRIAVERTKWEITQDNVDQAATTKHTETMTESIDTLSSSKDQMTSSTDATTSTDIPTTTNMMTQSTNTMTKSTEAMTTTNVMTQSTNTMTTTDTMTRSTEAMTDSTTSSMVASVSASQQQVSFNKAIAKVSANKDKRIAELELRERQLVDEQHNIKDTIEKLLKDKHDLDAELQGALSRAQEGQWQAVQEKERMAERMKDMKKRLGEDGDGGNEGAMKEEDEEEEVVEEAESGSPAELVVSTQSDGLMEATETKEQLRALLHVKEQECHTLKRQLMHMRTSSLGGKTERVAISDISLGDLVFIFFQEGQENYMVYSIEPTLYFLHTESLAGLGLRQKAAEGSRMWTIARITDKEYCQAKKAQNRFKVSVGTKFYRVKAVRYETRVEQVPRK